MKRYAAALLSAAVLMLPLLSPARAASAPAVDAGAAILMEKETGTILYEQNSHDKLEPASVTKVMTLLLVMEAVDEGRVSLDDLVTVSAHAAGMGGSQTYMEQGEQFTVRDMLKAVAVVSGNDAAVALAEHLSGSEESFVALMNRRAAELGMTDTAFQNCTGLPAAGHLTSAHDIAVMSRELILNHPGIREMAGLAHRHMIDAVLVSDISRLCRDCGQALRLEGKLKKQGVSIESIKGNPLPEYRRARIALGCIMK